MKGKTAFETVLDRLLEMQRESLQRSESIDDLRNKISQTRAECEGVTRRLVTLTQRADRAEQTAQGDVQKRCTELYDATTQLLKMSEEDHRNAHYDNDSERVAIEALFERVRTALKASEKDTDQIPF